MPPRIGEREWFRLVTERFGFLIASGLTLLVLAILFINTDLLLQEPDSALSQPVTEVQSTSVEETTPLGGQSTPIEEESAPAENQEEGSETSEAPEPPAAVMVPLSIATNPALASILIDGKYVGETPLQGVTLAEGMHQVRIQKHNYIRLDTVITVSEVASSLQLTLRENRDAILAEQAAAEAAAEALAAAEDEQPAPSEDEPPEPPVADSEDDPTPLADEQPATTDEQQSSPSDETDSADSEQTAPPVTAEEDELLAVEEETPPVEEDDPAPEEDDPVPEEEPEALVGKLQINSEPSGALVLVGGSEVGVTPLLMTDLEAGTRQITLRLDGYDDFTTTAEVVAQQRSTVNGQLQAQAPPEQAASTLKILAKPWGTIYIDDKLYKRETNIWYTTQLPPGTYRVKIEHATLGTWTQQVVLEPGEERILEVDFN